MYRNENEPAMKSALCLWQKIVKCGTLWDFLRSNLLQNIETNEGGPFGKIQNFSKSLIVPKKI